MNLNIKHIIIIASTFILVLWVQRLDDKKNKIENKSYYELFKLPLLIASIIGLILTINNCANCGDVTIIAPIKQCMSKLFTNNTNIASDQQIYTDLPDF